MDEELEIIDEEESELDKMRQTRTGRRSAVEIDETPRKRTKNTADKVSMPKPKTVPKKHPGKKTKKVLRKVKPRKSKRVTGIKLILLSILLIPLFTYLYIISLHSDRLINGFMSIVMLICSIISFLILIIGIIMAAFNKKVKTGKKVKTWFKVIMGIFLAGYVGVSSTIMILLYGPNDSFREWLVTTAMMTMNHQYLAKWFYSDDVISEILSRNNVIESGEDTNPDLVEIGGGEKEVVYANKYEEAILKRDKGNDVYKIIDIAQDDFKGKMAVVYDPSKVKVAVSKGLGSNLSTSYGQMITAMSKDNNASIAINGGGFYDPDWNSRGGVPHGVVISNGKLITNGHGRAVGVGGLIGFNKENKLVLARMSSSEALAQGIRDAVDFGPFLIVNGKPSFVKGNGGWGKSPRTAIAQRKDGIVLLLVIDGRQRASAGADMVDLVDVLTKYGAYNAANLDGGTSSAMALNGEIITNPRNGSFKPKTRAVPNAWIVTK